MSDCYLKKPFNCVQVYFNIIEPKKPITLALIDDVINFISQHIREGKKSKYSI